MTGPSHFQEQKERRELLENERELRTTFHQFAESEAGSVGGRFAQHGRSGVSGTKPAVDYPTLPASNSTNQQAAVPAEPTIDARDCGDTFGIALGEAHEQFCEDDGPANSSLQGSALGVGAQAKLDASSYPASPSSTPLRKRRI